MADGQSMTIEEVVRRVAATALARTVGLEQREVDAAWDDRELVARGAHSDEREHLVGARGHDLVHAADDVALDGRALERRGVLVALLAALDHPERVKGLHDRHRELARRQQRRVARHPKVGVDDVGPVRAPRPHELAREGRHVLEQRVLR
jgi:hypothetical protein